MSRVFLSPPIQVGETLTSVSEDSRFACRDLESADDDICVERIKLDAAADPPHVVCRDEGRAGAKEGIDDKLAPVRQVQKDIFQHCRWLHGRMVLQPSARVRAQ